MANWLDSLLSLVFPLRCEVCKKQSNESLCSECFEQIKFMKPHLGIYNVSVYEGVVRDAIHRFKFKKRKNLAEPLGVLLVKYLSHTPAIEMRDIDVIIPVPLHSRRLRKRGFNQSKMLADVLSRYFEVPVVQALERVKHTKAQFDLPRTERFRNVVKAFKVSNNKSVFNKRALLLDDIYTTGATIAECSKALKIAGAKRVEVLTLSRAIEN
jgi:ComF family protein